MRRILVVDDEELMRKMMGKILTRAGMDVVLVGDGETAIRIFKKDPETYDLVVMDLIMPGLDGKEAARQIRQIRTGMKVLFLTGNGVAWAYDSCGLALSEAVLAKPFFPQGLVDKVLETIEA